MFPKSISSDARGCLSVLIHAGTFHTQPCQMNFMPWKDGKPTGESVPFLGTVGTNDPAISHHTLWFEGQIFEANLACDVPFHRPTFDELYHHFLQHRGCWTRLGFAAA